MNERLEPGVLLFSVAYPERSNRLLIFVRWLLLIPHFFILYFFGFLINIVTFIAWFAILITGAYPRGMWDLAVAYQIWTANVSAYYLNMRDEYPPFGQSAYPVQYDLVYPQDLSRLLIFVKWLLVIPHLIVLAVLGIGAVAAYVIAWFAILITGRFPLPLFGYLVGVMRWGLRVNAYVMLLTDVYPPFSLE